MRVPSEREATKRLNEDIFETSQFHLCQLAAFVTSHDICVIILQHGSSLNCLTGWSTSVPMGSACCRFNASLPIGSDCRLTTFLLPSGSSCCLPLALVLAHS